MANAPKAPVDAPQQTTVTTGGGSLAKGQQPRQGPRKPPPASSATTGPKITAPSVNYNGGQETAPQVQHLGASGRDYADQQAQEMQDQAGG